MASIWRNLPLTNGKIILFLVVGMFAAAHLGKTVYYRVINRDHRALEDFENGNRLDDFLGRMVVVIALSNNQFIGADDLISSIHNCLPHNHMILYDLGLNLTNKRKIQELYNFIEIRQFPFNDYRHLPHVKDLLTHAWKPILVRDVSLEYDAIMYADPCVRMISCNVKKSLDHFFKFPFVARLAHGMVIEVSHDGMIQYLKYPESRKDIANVRLLQTHGLIMWANPTMKNKLIEPWYDCAIHQECIAPEGAKSIPCEFTTVHDGHYIGCHRYEQSALNLILNREFGATTALRAGRLFSFQSIWEFKKVVPKKTQNK